MINSLIIGTGKYIPEMEIDGRQLSQKSLYDEDGKLIEKPFNETLKKFIDITKIEKRRYAPDSMSNSEMGRIAAEKAIEESKIDREKIDYIIYATNYGEVGENGQANFMPSASARLKNKLKIENRKCITYDMVFGCPGFVEAVILANNLILANKAKVILVVGSDFLSRVVDPFDRNKLIFADGAAAMMLIKNTSPKKGIIHSNTICDNGEEIDFMWNGNSYNKNHDQNNLYIKMRGRKIYEYALKNVPLAIKNTIDEAKLTISDIKKIIIHQANAKMDEAIITRLFKLYNQESYSPNILPMTVHFLGNSSVATVPTLYDLIDKGELGNHRFLSGDYIIMASLGASMNINCILYQIP
ncbi:3-oxoacyl-ACP synthase III family protein [Flavivirga sp. 57AJ16]|uniref:3-oxoacyl-ACP synthase III family protein n=1 Tax=Flavivirga sp. 57AJ16 TaxID=3025307 RepID=UPI00236653E9|nr:3-oxoacyl-ACP synthase III family protein [Flavivirga sp. 57AJ16]MDD7885070.1 3-oxoacyl-ACP synthase III family protein [Flavivirga sp. 57AJ16]